MNAVRLRHRGVVEVAYALRTRNPNNGAMGHSRLASILKSKERRQQREVSMLQVLSLAPLPELPVIVTVTRLAPSGGLDPHDGLGAALKGVIDGTADALGLKNDRDARVTWRIEQDRSPRGYYGVRIRIEARP